MKSLNKKLSTIEALFAQPREQHTESLMEIDFRKYHLLPEYREKVTYLLLLFKYTELSLAGEDVHIDFPLKDLLQTFEDVMRSGHYHVTVLDFIEHTFSFAADLNPELLEAAKAVQVDPSTLSYFNINNYREMVCAYLQDADVYKIGPIEFLAKHGLAPLYEIE